MSYPNWYYSAPGHNWDDNDHQFHGYQDSVLRSVTVRPPGRRASPYHPNQRGNSHPQSSFTSYNQHRNNYPRHQRNEPLTTIQGNRSNINPANLSYVSLQESSSSSKAQGNSQTSNLPKDPLRKQQQQQNTKVLMTTPPFLEIVVPLLEVLLFPTGKFVTI